MATWLSLPSFHFCRLSHCLPSSGPPPPPHLNYTGMMVLLTRLWTPSSEFVNAEVGIIRAIALENNSWCIIILILSTKFAQLQRGKVLYVSECNDQIHPRKYILIIITIIVWSCIVIVSYTITCSEMDSMLAKGHTHSREERERETVFCFFFSCQFHTDWQLRTTPNESAKIIMSTAVYTPTSQSHGNGDFYNVCKKWIISGVIKGNTDLLNKHLVFIDYLHGAYSTLAPTTSCSQWKPINSLSFSEKTFAIL